MTLDRIVEQLKEMGCKLTPQRRLLIEAMLVAGGLPMTVDDIFQKIRATYPEVGLDTVYRNLHLLSRLGLVDEVRLPGKLAQYAINQDSHQHGLICLECGRKVAMSQCPIRELAELAREQYGFVIASHRLELYGYCIECQGAHDRG